MSRTRLLALIVLGGGIVFAIGGGEYGTFDWLELRRQEREEQAAILRLRAEVDSLTRYAERIQSDRRLQEQLARENFGMIRKGEFLYRLGTDSLDGE